MATRRLDEPPEPSPATPSEAGGNGADRRRGTTKIKRNAKVVCSAGGDAAAARAFQCWQRGSVGFVLPTAYPPAVFCQTDFSDPRWVRSAKLSLSATGWVRSAKLACPRPVRVVLPNRPAGLPWVRSAKLTCPRPVGSFCQTDLPREVWFGSF